MSISAVNHSEPNLPPKLTGRTGSATRTRDAAPAAATGGSARAAATSTQAAPDGGEHFDAGAYAPLQQAMKNLPDSRADVVARGKLLAADPHYPSAEVVAKLSRLFVADAVQSEAALA